MVPRIVSVLGSNGVRIKRCLPARRKYEEQPALPDRLEASSRTQKSRWPRFISFGAPSSARAYRPPSSRALAQVAARHRRRRCATPIPLRARPSCRRVRFHDRSTPAPTGGSRHRSDSGRSHWHQLMSSRLSSRRFASRAIPASVSAKVFAFPVVDGAANTSFGYVGANAGAVFRSTPQAFAASPANA